MTQKLFWDDPYRTSVDTQITGVAGEDVTVAHTIFYTFSGGQESDAGTIGGHAVRDSHKQGQGIVYTLDPQHGFQAGDVVRMAIDWQRRYRLMRLHFAAELVLETTYRRCAGITKIGAHIAPEKARIDFQWPESLAPLLPAIHQDVRALVQADHAITSAFSDVIAERRYWEVAGFARVPCGGTHLRRTGEVGAISLKRKNVGKHKERIEILI